MVPSFYFANSDILKKEKVVSTTVCCYHNFIKQYVNSKT